MLYCLRSLWCNPRFLRFARILDPIPCKMHRLVNLPACTHGPSISPIQPNGRRQDGAEIDFHTMKRSLRYETDVVRAILSGEADSLKFLDSFWKYQATSRERDHFQKFCRLIRVYAETGLVKESARRVGIDQH